MHISSTPPTLRQVLPTARPQRALKRSSWPFKTPMNRSADVGIVEQARIIIAVTAMSLRIVK